MVLQKHGHWGLQSGPGTKEELRGRDGQTDVVVLPMGSDPARAPLPAGKSLLAPAGTWGAGQGSKSKQTAMGEAGRGDSLQSKAGHPGAEVKLPRPSELSAQPQGGLTNIGPEGLQRPMFMTKVLSCHPVINDGNANPAQKVPKVTEYNLFGRQ